jgi:hypothetical protein
MYSGGLGEIGAKVYSCLWVASYYYQNWKHPTTNRFVLPRSLGDSRSEHTRLEVGIAFA